MMFARCYFDGFMGNMLWWWLSSGYFYRESDYGLSKKIFGYIPLVPPLPRLLVMRSLPRAICSEVFFFE
jgi:hypothetical protein